MTTAGKPCHSVHPPTAHTTANQRLPRNLLQELLLLLLLIAVVPLLLTVTLWLQQQISVDPVEAGGGDGAEALPPEQPPPVVLVHIWQGVVALAYSQLCLDVISTFCILVVVVFAQRNKNMRSEPHPISILTVAAEGVWERRRAGPVFPECWLQLLSCFIREMSKQHRWRDKFR